MFSPKSEVKDTLNDRIHAVLTDLKTNHNGNPREIFKNHIHETWRLFFELEDELEDNNLEVFFNDSTKYHKENLHKLIKISQYYKETGLAKTLTKTCAEEYKNNLTEAEKKVKKLKDEYKVEEEKQKDDAKAVMQLKIKYSKDILDTYKKVAEISDAKKRAELYKTIKQAGIEHPQGIQPLESLLAIDPSDLHLPITEFIEKYPAYYYYIIQFLHENYKFDILTDTLEQFKFKHYSVKALDSDYNWWHFDLKEPGYLGGVISAYRYLLDQLDAKITTVTIDMIKEVHKRCSSARGTNYHLGGQEKPGEFDQKFLSPEQLQHRVQDLRLLTKHFNPQYEYLDSIKLTNKNNASENGLRQFLAMKSRYLPVFINPLYNVRCDSKDPIKYFEQGGNFLMFRVKPKEGDAIEFLNQTIEKYLATLNQTLGNPKTTAKDKLFAIIDFTQDVSLTHPFYDLNTRTFVMNIFNFLLMAHGFPPAILIDPNRFEGYSRDELLQQTIEGMERTLKVAKGEKISLLTTQEITALATDSYRKYFEEVIKILDPQFTLDKMMKPAKNDFTPK